MAKARPPDDFNNSPIAWFAEFLHALDGRDVEQAARAKAELTRLGWTFRYRKPRPEADGQAVAR